MFPSGTRALGSAAAGVPETGAGRGRRGAGAPGSGAPASLTSRQGVQSAVMRDAYASDVKLERNGEASTFDPGSEYA